MAFTGQRSFSVEPIKMWIPLRNGSVLDAFMCTLRSEGLHLLSTATSEKLRWTPASYSASVGTVSSPALRKPKKHRHEAAQSIMLSKLLDSFSHIFLILSSDSGVIGNRSV